MKNHLLLIALLTVAAAMRAGTPIIDDPLHMQKLSGTYTTDVHVYKDNGVFAMGIVRFATGKKIIVHPGGILKIYNATITHTDDNFSNTLSNKFWGGIVVLGDPNKAQTVEAQKLCNNAHITCFKDGQKNPGDTLGTGSGGVTECMGKFSQGMVYASNATFRYAVVAISVGDTYNDLSHMGYPSGPQGGGLVYVKYCTFENNINASITFAQYFKFPQLSWIRNNYFRHTFKSGQLGTTGPFIMANLNKFKFGINYNEFSKTVGTNFGGSGGFMLMETDVTIQNNQFNNLDQGIASFTYQPGIASQRISNNILYDIHFSGMTITNSNNLNISDNWVYLGRNFSAGDCYGIAFSEPKIGNINHNNVLRLRSNSYNENGIVSHNNFQQSCQIVFNTIKKIDYGYQAQRNNLGTRLGCNTLTLNKLYDMTVTSSPGLGIQGAPSKGAGNTFSSIPGRPGSNINSSNAPNFKYYFSSGISTQNPQNVLNVSKFPATGNNYCAYSEDLGLPEKGYCFSLPGHPYTNSHPRSARVNTATGVMTAIEAGGVLPSEQDDYNTAVIEYDVAMGDLIGYYHAMSARDTIDSTAYNDSIFQLLNGYKTITGKYLLVDWYINRGQYSDANALIATMLMGSPTQSTVDFCSFATLMISYRQSDYSAAWLSSNFSTLKTIADGSGYAGPRARVLVQYAADIDTTNAYHDSILYPFVVEPVPGDTIIPPDTYHLSVVVSPNPFDGQLDYTIDNTSGGSRPLTITVTDMNNTVLFSQNQTVNLTYTSNFNTSSLPSGYYVFNIYEGGNLVYYCLLYK